jgi:hypothetical protein
VRVVAIRPPAAAVTVLDPDMLTVTAPLPRWRPSLRVAEARILDRAEPPDREEAAEARILDRAEPPNREEAAEARILDRAEPPNREEAAEARILDRAAEVRAAAAAAWQIRKVVAMKALRCLEPE